MMGLASDDDISSRGKKISGSPAVIIFRGVPGIPPTDFPCKILECQDESLCLSRYGVTDFELKKNTKLQGGPQADRYK